MIQILMKRYISLIILIFLCIEMSYSQNIKITGIVKDLSFASKV